MTKSCLAVLSGLAFGGAIIVNAPFAWSQADTGKAPSAGQSKERGSQAQKPTTDAPMSESPSSGAKKPGMSREKGTQAGTESGLAKGQHLSSDKVKEIQEALKSKGFDPGTADGLMGPKTSQAIREFQKSENLQVTGRVDEKTAKALGVEAGGMTGSTSSMGGAKRSRQESGDPSASEKEKTGAREPGKGAGSGSTKR